MKCLSSVFAGQWYIRIIPYIYIVLCNFQSAFPITVSFDPHRRLAKQAGKLLLPSPFYRQCGQAKSIPGFEGKQNRVLFHAPRYSSCVAPTGFPTLPSFAFFICQLGIIIYEAIQRIKWDRLCKALRQWLPLIILLLIIDLIIYFYF